ncbi:MAG TPA: YkgJ family cysteine cluster protein [Bdellovibrio sp.]
MKKTLLLQNFLSQQQDLLNHEDYQALSNEVDDLILKYQGILEVTGPGIARAQKVHEFLNEQNQAFSHVKTSCPKGCGFCCHLEVEITQDDAEALAEEVARLNIPLDLERLTNQSQRIRQDAAWAKGAVPENRCVMLDETNSCRVYEARQTNCRRLSVVSPVSDCHTPGASPVSRIIPMTEFFMSGYISIPSLTFGSLSKMLIPALEKIQIRDQMRSLDFVEENPNKEIDEKQRDLT